MIVLVLALAILRFRAALTPHGRRFFRCLLVAFGGVGRDTLPIFFSMLLLVLLLFCRSCFLVLLFARLLSSDGGASQHCHLLDDDEYWRVATTTV